MAIVKIVATSAVKTTTERRAEGLSSLIAIFPKFNCGGVRVRTRCISILLSLGVGSTDAVGPIRCHSGFADVADSPWPDVRVMTLAL